MGKAAEGSQVNEQPLQFYRLWLVVGLLLVGLVTVLTLIPPDDYQQIIRFDMNDKAAHFLAYGVLAGWFGCLSLGQRLMAPTLLLIALGTVLELAQMSSLYRMFDRYDLLANWFGVAVGITCMFTPLRLILQWVERKLILRQA